MFSQRTILTSVIASLYLLSCAQHDVDSEKKSGNQPAKSGSDWGDVKSEGVYYDDPNKSVPKEETPGSTTTGETTSGAVATTAASTSSGLGTGDGGNAGVVPGPTPAPSPTPTPAPSPAPTASPEVAQVKRYCVAGPNKVFFAYSTTEARDTCVKTANGKPIANDPDNKSGFKLSAIDCPCPAAEARVDKDPPTSCRRYNPLLAGNKLKPMCKR